MEGNTVEHTIAELLAKLNITVQPGTTALSQNLLRSMASKSAKRMPGPIVLATLVRKTVQKE